MTRRELIGALSAAAGTTLTAAAPTPKLAVFTKHLQFLTGEALAEALAEIGADAADLSVRKGGHIAPARVKQDLPPLLKALEKRRIAFTMATTDIVDSDSPFAAEVLSTLSSAGVKHYRWGGFKFDPLRPVVDQIEALKPRVKKLAEFNKQYGMCAMYHTHSGLNQLGAAIWDLHLLLKDFDPRYVAVNYDIGHATVEGGFGGWIESLNVTGPHLQGVALKDVHWTKGPKGWHSVWCPIGEGMVRFDQFFAILRRVNFIGPMQVHFEYPLGDAESGARQITMPKQQVLDAMKRDLDRLREIWKA